MWFKVRASDTAFADTSKRHFTYDFRVDLSPSDAFLAVTSPMEMGRWMPDLAACKWITAPPHGVGSVREVRFTTIAVQERILLWEPGERFTFTVVRATAPILKRMVEDFHFEPMPSVTAGPATRVRWTIAYQPRTLAMPLERVLAPRFTRMFEAACRGLTRVASERVRA